MAGYPRSSASLSAQPDRARRYPDPALRSDDEYDDRYDRRERRGQADVGRSPRGSLSQPEQGSRLRGSVAVLGVLLLALATSFLDRFLAAPGLGTITLVGLTLATALGTLLVRRRDLITLVIAPPLVLVVVVAVQVATAAGFSVPEGGSTLRVLATAVASKVVLGGGFPMMAVATGTALVLALIRWAARR